MLVHTLTDAHTHTHTHIKKKKKKKEICLAVEALAIIMKIIIASAIQHTVYLFKHVTFDYTKTMKSLYFTNVPYFF